MGDRISGIYLHCGIHLANVIVIYLIFLCLIVRVYSLLAYHRYFVEQHYRAMGCKAI